jgi:CHAD domain-containing protein
MPYKLISGRPLAQEIRRLLDQETIAATTTLTQASPAAQICSVHDTRKHIKKARALLRMSRRPLGRRYLEVDHELRTANRALGPLGDAHRVLETLAAIRREGIVRLPTTTFSTVRLQLEARAAAIEAGASVDDVRARTVRLLKSLRQEVAAADLQGLDRSAIVGEIRDVHAAARHARRRATKRPSVDSFHRWRRHVKREWHLFRLVAELTGDRLRDERHQLAALDACLGELHDVDVLTSALAANSPLSRMEMSHVLKALRGHARDLRRLARRLSSVLDERPQSLARRVRMLWGSVSRRRVAATVSLWQHRA